MAAARQERPDEDEAAGTAGAKGSPSGRSEGSSVAALGVGPDQREDGQGKELTMAAGTPSPRRIEYQRSAKLELLTSNVNQYKQ